MSKDFKIIRNTCPHVCINILRTLFPDEISRVIRNSCIITVCAQFVCRIRRVSRRPRKRGRDRERESGVPCRLNLDSRQDCRAHYRRLIYFALRHSDQQTTKSLHGESLSESLSKRCLLKDVRKYCTRSANTSMQSDRFPSSFSNQICHCRFFQSILPSLNL